MNLFFSLGRNVVLTAESKSCEAICSSLIQSVTGIYLFYCAFNEVVMLIFTRI